MSKRAKFLSWIPAVLVLGTTIVTVAGISLIPTVGAANPQNVTVTGTVGSNLDFSTTCGGTVAFVGNFASAGPAKLSPDCTMTFNTNWATGAKVSLADYESSAAQDPTRNAFFCKLAVACDGTLPDNEFGDVAAADSQLDTDATNGTDDSFGYSLYPLAGDASALGVTVNDGTPAAGEAVWNPILPDAGTAICESATSTSGASCVVVFGGEPGGVQNSGNYSGTAIFTVAND